MKLYVGNLSFSTTQSALEAAFAEHGEVEEVALITDRDTGQPRGFGFVTMRDDNAARAAMQAMDGKEFDGRALKVNEAKAKTGGGGGGGGRGGW
jgi:RNA recognition motif-containing protein